MIRYGTKQSSSEYVCKKDAKHREISVSGQKKKCWQCGSVMVEKVNAMPGMVMK